MHMFEKCFYVTIKIEFYYGLVFPLLYSWCCCTHTVSIQIQKSAIFYLNKIKMFALLVVVHCTCISVHYFWLRFTEGTFCTITHVSYDCPFVLHILSQIWVSLSCCVTLWYKIDFFGSFKLWSKQKKQRKKSVLKL